jgi:hypothetical protein
MEQPRQNQRRSSSSGGLGSKMSRNRMFFQPPIPNFQPGRYKWLQGRFFLGYIDYSAHHPPTTHHHRFSVHMLTKRTQTGIPNSFVRGLETCTPRPFANLGNALRTHLPSGRRRTPISTHQYPRLLPGHRRWMRPCYVSRPFARGLRHIRAPKGSNGTTNLPTPAVRASERSAEEGREGAGHVAQGRLEQSAGEPSFDPVAPRGLAAQARL